MVFCAFWLTNVLLATAACHFGHLNFKNRSRTQVICTFWLENVLCATAAWHFWTSERPKLVRARGVLCVLTCKCASRLSGVPFFICLLNSYLRTRRFSEAIFRNIRNPEPRIIEETQRFATFLTFGACVASFSWLYSRDDLLSTDLTALLLCFSTVHIVGSYIDF